MPNTQNRTRKKQITFRLTEEEFSSFENKRKQTSKSQTDFILACVSRKQIVVVDGLREILVELKREGNNLNQILRFANEYGSLDTQGVYATIENLNSLYKFLIDLSRGKLENADIQRLREQSYATQSDSVYFEQRENAGADEWRKQESLDFGY